MAIHQTGVAITIKAFLPTGKSLDENFAALSLVKTAHETGDYAPLLAVAKVEDVKTEQKTRRVEAPVAAPVVEEPAAVSVSEVIGEDEPAPVGESGEEPAPPVEAPPAEAPRRRAAA